MEMVAALIEVQDRVLNLAPDREQVVLACSGPADESTAGLVSCSVDLTMR